MTDSSNQRETAAGTATAPADGTSSSSRSAVEQGNNDAARRTTRIVTTPTNGGSHKQVPSEAAAGAAAASGTSVAAASGTSAPDDGPEPEPATVVICGAGIIGLVLAISLYEHCGLRDVELYEKVSTFHNDVGAGMGMYPNGLRVIRDISDELLSQIQENGYPYLRRRIEEHTGKEIITADENVLSEGDDEIQPLGIRRWILQKILYEKVQELGIPVYFGKRTMNIVEQNSDSNSNTLVRIEFDDGTWRDTKLVFGADGSKSTIRTIVTNGQHELKYTGTTCLMGMADDCARPERGICTPASTTTQCHAAFFPTNPDAQCFQFHFPVQEEDADPGNWGTLSDAVGQMECQKLAEQLRQDGWHEKYLDPLLHVTRAVRIGFCVLEPRLDKFVFGNGQNIVLIGDAAHPPTPYTGQGAQMGLEDVGVVSMLMKHLCIADDDDSNGRHRLDFRQLSKALKLYEKMRIPRVTHVQSTALDHGRRQQKMATSTKFNVVQQEKIQRSVFFHENLPAVLPGAQYDYRKELEKELAEFNMQEEEEEEPPEEEEA